MEKEHNDKMSKLPPALQHALKKNAEKSSQESKEDSVGPRVAFTGNPKLDELLAGIKETVYKYEEIFLPSMGKFYDGQIAPNDGKLHVRCMTGEEEQILATPRFIRKGQAINMIFKNCVREPIIPENLLVIDRTWLIIYLRGISYTTDYQVDVRCSECGRKFESTIDLDSLYVTTCPDDFGPERLRDVLPKSKYKISYRLATGKDEQLISDYRDKKNKQENASDDTWIYRAALLIDDIEGLTDKQALQALITRLPIQDVAYIRSLLNDPPFGVDTKITIWCDFCNRDFTIEMPMEASFFFPSPRKENKTQA